MLGICSEPGLSSKEVITGVVSRFNSLGTKVIRRFMGRLDPSAASASIVRLARDLAKSPGPCLVVLERIPPSDEGCVLRQARALTRMWECGASVLFSLNPEAAQLLGQLPECLVLGSKDLLLSSVVDAMKDRRAQLVDALTYGIVDLVAVIERLSDDDLFEDRLPHAYGDALSRLVSPALRRSLPDEELRVRLCMLLLGSGDLSAGNKHDRTLDGVVAAEDVLGGGLHAIHLHGNQDLAALIGLVVSAEARIADAPGIVGNVGGQLGHELFYSQ